MSGARIGTVDFYEVNVTVTIIGDSDKVCGPCPITRVKEEESSADCKVHVHVQDIAGYGTINIYVEDVPRRSPRSAYRNVNYIRRASGIWRQFNHRLRARARSLNMKSGHRHCRIKVHE